MQKIAISITILFIVGCACDASDRKARGRSAWAWANATEAAKPVASSPAPTGAECKDALAEVNEARKARGLPPFQHDPLLSQAAYSAAKQRASQGLAGHLDNDFACLPTGAKADAAGCAMWGDGEGWGSCCTYDSYSHAGAAWVVSGGQRFMHLFVRNESPTVFKAEPNVIQSFQSAGSCASGSCGISERRGLFRRR